MKVFKNQNYFVLEVPAARKAEIAELMAYRGAVFSTSASSREKAVLFSENPYAFADLADPVECPELAPYQREIDLSRALQGNGTGRLPPGKELWDFQKATLDYLLARGGGIDADQPGCGKTPTAIAFCNAVEAYRVLVIVPASVRIQWGERIREWSTIPNVKASVMLKVKDGIHPTAHYQVISYDSARNPAIIRAISKYKWDVLVCDEAHKMKNIDALTTRAVLGNRDGMYQHGDVKEKAIARYCEKHIALTGTLLLNRPSECLASSTLVLTNQGWRPIVQIKKTDLLWDGVEWVAHRGLLYQGCAQTVSVGQISATPTHRFLAKSTWVSAEEAHQSTALWSQILVKGSENLPFSAFNGIQAVLNFVNVLVVAGVKLKRPFKNCDKVRLSVAGHVAPRTDQKKLIQNTMKFARTLSFAKGFSELCRVSGIVAKTQKANAIAHMGDEASEYFPNGLQIGRLGWRILFLCLTMTTQLCNWIGGTTIGDTCQEICASSHGSEIWRTAVRFSSFKRAWMWLCRKSTCSEPVFDIANAGPRQRFTILSADGPIISHNCYVLLRHFDHEAIDFATEDQFKDRYNKQADMKTIDGKRFKLERTSLENELQNRLRVNVMARHEKKDVLPWMKPPRFSIVRCEENGTVKDALDAEGMLGLSIDDISTTKDFEILGHIAEARRLMGMALAPQIIEYAADFLEGSEEKLVIFGWHIDVLSLFEEGLARFGTVRIDGQKSANQRQQAVDDFISQAHKRVCIANLLAGGEGVDGLQKVCYRCYLAEPDWVPARNEQAVARLDRIGQEQIVNAEIFVAPGSISEKILVRALEKMNVIHRVLDAKGD